jgi:Mitochondrial carrier protein
VAYTVASDRTSRVTRVVGGFTFSCVFICSCPSPCFAKTFPACRGDLLAVTTNSNAARLSKLQTSLSLPRSIFYTLQKRVRSHLASFAGLSLHLYFVGAVTAILTNPIWVVKVRTFTAPANSPAAHRGLFSACHACLRPKLELIFPSENRNAPGGFRAIYRAEGLRALYRGTTLALVGVSNGALQFMTYEKMKSWAFERKRRRYAKLGRAWTMDDDKLVRNVLFRAPKA